MGLENKITQEDKKEFKEIKKLARHLDKDHGDNLINAYDLGLIDLDEARLAQNMFDYLETQKEKVGAIKDDYVGFGTDAVKIGAVTYGLFANSTFPYYYDAVLTGETIGLLGLLGISAVSSLIRYFGSFRRHRKQNETIGYLISYIEHHDSLYYKIMNLTEKIHSEEQEKRDSLLREIYHEDISSIVGAQALSEYEKENNIDYEKTMNFFEDYRPEDSLDSKRKKLTQDIVTGAGNVFSIGLAYIALQYGINAEEITVMISAFLGFGKDISPVIRHWKQMIRAKDRVKIKKNEPVYKQITNAKVENPFLDTYKEQTK